MTSVCSTDGCDKPRRTRGMCNACYEYWRKHGTVERAPVRLPIPPAERVWTHVDKNGPIPAHRSQLGPCWLWTAWKNSKGYGLFRWDGAGKVPAHRAVWLVSVGPIPDGLQLDHLCRVKACVNPAHLESVTNAENMRRAKVLRTHCRSGRHPWTAENQLARKDGSVICRPCSNERVAAWKRAHR